MAFQAPIELTWRNLFKASFLAIGDAALIAMIKDQALTMQVAMVAASIIGFTALVKEDWLRSKNRYAFQLVLGISGSIFIVFVIFAVSHAFKEHNVDGALDTFRSRGIVLEQRPFEVGMSQDDITKWQSEIETWSNETSKYLNDNISETTKNRFRSTVGHGYLLYNGISDDINQRINKLNWYGKNLQEIMNQRGQKSK